MCAMRMNVNLGRGCLVMLGVLWGPSAAMALLDVDIGARIENGRLVNWASDHQAGVYLERQRVFAGLLDELGGVVSGDEPGFFFLPSNELSGARVGINVRAAARVWDPAGGSSAAGENFQAISAASVTLGSTILGSVTTPAADPLAPIAGPSITVPLAGVDFHYPLTLNGSATGIYLVELEQWTDVAGVANSLPFWIVLNYGLPEPEHERAVEYVQSFVVPAPGAGGLLLATGIWAARRRRGR